MSIRPSTIFGLLMVLVGVSVFFTAHAASAGDCTEIDLSFEQYAGPLTDAEITRRREAAQTAALNQLDRCSSGAASGGGQGGGQGTGGGAQGGGGSQGADGASQASSVAVAASGVAGTQAPPDSEVLQTPPDDAQDPQQVASQDQSTTSQANGRAPLDIPPADSDSALAAQIRRAAESETDPERQALLWNEYRKIRGLPTR